MDGRGGFAVELLIDDALDEGFKWGLRAGEAQRKWSGAGDQLSQFGIGGGEFSAGELVVVAGWTRAVGDACHVLYRNSASLRMPDGNRLHVYSIHAALLQNDWPESRFAASKKRRQRTMMPGTRVHLPSQQSIPASKN